MVIIYNNKKLRWYQSLRAKLFICFFFISFFPLVLFSNIMKNTMEGYFKDIEEREQLYQANKIAVMMQEGSYLSKEDKKEELLASLQEKSTEEDFRVLIIDDNGLVVLDTNNTDIGKTFLIPEVLLALDGKNASNYYKDQGVIS